MKVIIFIILKIILFWKIKWNDISKNLFSAWHIVSAQFTLDTIFICSI